MSVIRFCLKKRVDSNFDGRSSHFSFNNCNFMGVRTVHRLFRHTNSKTSPILPPLYPPFDPHDLIKSS